MNHFKNMPKALKYNLLYVQSSNDFLFLFVYLPFFVCVCFSSIRQMWFFPKNEMTNKNYSICFDEYGKNVYCNKKQ